MTKPARIKGVRDDGHPDTQIAIIDGQPELVVNAAMVEELIKQSPLGEAEARRRIVAAGYPRRLAYPRGDAR